MRIVIIGGGAAGLFVAHFLRKYDRCIDITIVSPNIGGLIRSERLAGFRFDFGGHVYSPSSELGKMMSFAEKHERKAFYHEREQRGVSQRFVPYPVQDHVRQLGNYSFPNQLPKGDYKNFCQWAIDLFGEEFCHHWFFPFNQRVWTISPTRMDYDWVDQRVKRPTENSIGWGPNATFLYASGEDIVQHFGGMDGDIHFVKDEVIGLNEYEVKTQSTLYPFDVCISTIEISKLLRWFPIPPMQKLASNRVMSIGLGLRCRLDLLDFTWIYCDLSSRCHRITLLSRYHPENAPHDWDSLLIEIPYRKSVAPFAYCGIDVQEELEYVLHIFKIRKRDIAVTWHGDEMGYPIPTIGVRDHVGIMKKSLPSNIFSIGRWGSHAYYNLEHVFHEANAAASMILGETTQENKDDYYSGKFYYRK